MAENITLIANSGIQFHTIYLNLDEKSDVFKVSTAFAEIVETDAKGNKEFFPVFPYSYEKDESTLIYIDRDSINPEAIDRKTGKIINEKINFDFVKTLNEQLDDEGRPIKDLLYTAKARESIDVYDNTWLPIPYFNTSYMEKPKISVLGQPNEERFLGPKAWARMWFSKIPTTERNSDLYNYCVVLAFDTKLMAEDAQRNIKDQAEYYCPTPSDADFARFDLCSDEDDIYDFCSTDSKPGFEGWILQWLFKTYKKKRTKQQMQQYMYLALYINLLKLLKKTNLFPTVSLHESSLAKSQNKLECEIDMVLDIGNSRTYGLLFETSGMDQKFKFSDVKPLEIRDLSAPYKTYNDLFSMRLAFIEPNFGKVDFNPPFPDMLFDMFKWPSLVRVGKEAERMTVINDKTDTHFTMSSPKRYLWDERESKVLWEFLTEKDVNYQGRNAAVIRGLNEHFTNNGMYIPRAIKNKKNATPQHTPLFSRKSTMTLALIEIFLQAISYINSYGFRKDRGDQKIPRKLKRITITCPTAMPVESQIALRELALDAAGVLRNYFGDDFIDPTSLRIIPDPEDLKRVGDPDMIDESDPTKRKLRESWQLDEATCSQLAYIYGEIMERYRGNVQLYFDTVGRKRVDAKYADQKSVTIASVDIGGGTTDMMICAYQFQPGANATVLTPDPQIWEGFNFAGDDFVRRIIEQIVLPSIAHHAKKLGCRNLIDIMQFMFGRDMPTMTSDDKMMRKQFANQIAIPVAYGVIQHAIDNLAVEIRTFDSFFTEYKRPNPQLVDYINAKFQTVGKIPEFDLNNVIFTLNTLGINTVVKGVAEKMIAELCTLIAQYSCDYLLLAGRPTMMPIIRDLFLKYLPVPSDRIIALGNYRTGKWYPSNDATGRITDPKTCVTVGATVAIMGELGRLDGFRLDMSLMKQKYVSTADYVGLYDENQAKISKIYLSPDATEFQIQFDAPMLIGFKQIDAPDWTGSMLYKLTYANLNSAAKLNKYLPLKLTIVRDPDKNKERLWIDRETLTDKDDNDMKHLYNEFRFSLQTLPDEEGYWIDNGIFNIPISYD